MSSDFGKADSAVRAALAMFDAIPGGDVSEKANVLRPRSENPIGTVAADRMRRSATTPGPLP